MGSSGLWEDRRPADYDRTGPSIPEPLHIVWLYLEGPCALKPSPRCAGNTTTPIQQLKPPLNPVRDNPVKTNDLFFFLMQKCTAKDVHKKAWLLVLFSTRFYLTTQVLCCLYIWPVLSFEHTQPGYMRIFVQI